MTLPSAQLRQALALPAPPLLIAVRVRRRSSAAFLCSELIAWPGGKRDLVVQPKAYCAVPEEFGRSSIPWCGWIAGSRIRRTSLQRNVFTIDKPRVSLTR